MSNQNGLPKHWRVAKLGEICETTSGGTPSRREPKYYQGNIPWVKSGELAKGLIVDTEEKITEAALNNSSAKLFPKGTLLIALYGATIGKLAFLGIEAATNQAVCGIFKSENIESKFLYHFLFFKRPSLIKESIGGAQPNISQGILKSIEIPLPPLAEQQRIIAKLEELFSELDAGLASLNIVARQLKTYRQAVLKWAFEGKLTNDHVTAGELPAGWKWVKVSEIAEVRLGRQRSPQKAFGENMCQYLRAANVTWGGLDLSDVKSMDFSPKEQEIYQLQKGDILLSEASGSVSEVGKPAIWNEQITNCCFQNTLIRVRPGNLAGSKFLHLRFYFDAKVGNFREIAKGVGIHHLGAAGMSNWLIALPPLEEQHRIVQEIESRLSVCEKLEETIGASLKQAEALRQSILKQAFAGKLVAPGE